MKADVAAKKTRLAAHAPAAAESKASQDAAVAPPDDKEAQGKAANAEKMNAAKPGEFDKKAFVDAVNKAIDAQAPKNLDEADKFAKSGKADQVKAEVDGKVTDGKDASAKDIDTATKAPPDTSAAQEKDVTPLTPDQAPGNPGAPSAADAVPEKQPAAVTDFSEGPAENDKAMADAEVTEDQLAKGNEPEFNEALSAKKTAEADAAKAPAKGRAAEDQQLSTAKENAAASGAQAMTALTATRATAGKQVDGGKTDTKSKDEKKRAEVTAKLQKVYDGTKKDVEETLSGLDKKVDSAFTSGEKAARDAFTADHKSRMKKYKDKRYSGMRGKLRWVKDKFAGLPKEANDLYQESRNLYVSRMQTVISSVADLIGAELGKAKARIAKGRTELKAEVDKLPADLKQFGEEAAKDFTARFDDLESTVDEKSEQLVQDLASKYTAALTKVDEEIKKLQEANKGLIDKAKDAIVGAIKTINELKNLLLGILAKAASAVMKIIKDPIGFLGNLVTGVGAGLNLFITNIADHLKTGVVSWLLGTAVKAGLDLPAKFDLKGIIQLIGSLLGLTWDNIRTRITRKGVPDEAMSAVETSVPVAGSLAREGPAGAVKEIQAETGDLKATILGKLTTYLIPTVLIAGITWIISLLNPASAFVRAVKGIIDIVTFIVTQGAQIADFVNAVLDAVIAIANGGQAGVPKLIEAALATSVPLLIGFLAALLGIGGLANKVKSVFQSVSRPVTRAIDKIVDFIAKKGKTLWRKLRKDKKGNTRTDKKHPGKQEEKQSPRDKRRLLREGIKAASKELDRHEGRLVPEADVRTKMSAIKTRYKLTELRAFENDSSWKIEAAINPRGSAASKAPTEKQLMESMRESLQSYGPTRAQEVHKEWGSQLSKSKIGGISIWDESTLKGTEEEALKNLEKSTTGRELIGYFKKARGKDLAKTDTFHKYALHETKADPPHTVRTDFINTMSQGALTWITGKEGGEKRIKSIVTDEDDTKVINTLPGIGFELKEYRYGRFTNLPNTGEEADPNLVDAVGKCTGLDKPIINFLKLIVNPDAEVNGINSTEFLKIWNKKGASAAWVKEQFRAARPGHHEWIPTNYIGRVLETAIESRDRDGIDTAVEWITLQHALRSFTGDVLWDMKINSTTTAITRDNLAAHTGAYADNTYSSVADPIFHGDPKKRHLPQDPGTRIPSGGLRGIFESFLEGPGGENKTARGFLSHLQALLEGGKIMWNGEISPDFPEDVYTVPVMGTYKRKVVTVDPDTSKEIITTAEMVDISVRDLANTQAENYQRVLQNFFDARRALTGPE
ncbi:phage tail protein [Streptomyces cyaneofuscatus]|uniref:phage tail protein n=1 Tax=Streptomyces cyaneofuscatus TaxID=66883 RepID=UPI0033A3D167